MALCSYSFNDEEGKGKEREGRGGEERRGEGREGMT